MGYQPDQQKEPPLTIQYKEIFRYKGGEYSLYWTPLRTHFERTGAKPAFDVTCTACWRGYVGTWEFQDDVLFLTDIDATIEQKPVTVADLFPGSGGRVRADWVTQLVRFPQGECISDFPVGYGVTPERGVLLSVWCGRLVLAEVDDNRVKTRVSSEVTGQLEAVFEPDEAAFIRAIRAAPQDRTPRLVYADWLDEREDPRGGLIRLEDERETAGDDPDRAEEWVKRKEALLKRVTHWLWMKLMDYPLPRNEYDVELIDWSDPQQ